MSITYSVSAAQHAQAVPRKARRESFIVPSEHILQSELNDAIPASAENFARRGVGQPAVPGVGDGTRRRAQIEMVERIQRIGANLHAMPLGDGDELLHADIPIPGAGTVNRIPLGVAPLPWLRRREG